MPEDTIPQPDNNPTDSNRTDSVQPPVRTGGQKVIQPSPELARELQAQQAAAPRPPEPQPPVVTDSAAAPQGPPQSEARQGQPMPSAPGSLYPEATHGVGTHSSYPAPGLAAEHTNIPVENNKTKLIITAVMVFGAYIVVVSALSLVSWIRLSSLKGVGSGSSVLGIILTGGELILGIGILMRRETARSIYVVLAIILLVFSLYGTYNYFNVMSKLDKSEQTYITKTQQEITQYQNNTDLSPSEKARIIKSLQDNVQRQKQQLSEDKSTLWPLLEGYAISLLPLVFLTRPAVKEVFD